MGESALEWKATRCHLSSNHCEITAPTAPSDASASTLNCPSSSGMRRQGAVVMVSFSVLKAVCCSASHFQVSFPVN